jgi:hypothetical protein
VYLQATPGLLLTLSAFCHWPLTLAAASTLHDLKYLERGAECFIFVDITCRTGTRGTLLDSLAGHSESLTRQC